MKSLFGEEIPNDPEIKKHQSPIQKYRASVHYRDAENSREACKYCSFLLYKRAYSKGFYKCSLQKISSGPATDVKLKKVCDRFKPAFLNIIPGGAFNG